jgi:hypothetical protein
MSEQFAVYYDAAVFADELLSGKAHKQLTTLIFSHECTLSVYRLKMNHSWYVIVIGEKPMQSLCESIHGILKRGRGVQLEDELLLYLLERSIEKWKDGDSECHY